MTRKTSYCMHCDSPFEIADDSWIGQSLQCSSCNREFVLEAGNVIYPDGEDEPVTQEEMAQEQKTVKNANEKACPYCGETIKAVAIKCRFCQSDLANKSGTRKVKSVENMYSCPECGEPSGRDAMICRSCEYDFGAGRNDNITTQCLYCGRTIAVKQDNCIHCGKENNWIHPLIGRFTSNKAFKTNFRVFTHRLSMSGEADSPMQTLTMQLGIGAFVAGVILLMVSYHPPSYPIGLFARIFGFMFIFITPVFAIIYGFHIGPDSKKTFNLDLSKKTPKWESNDDEFWSEISQFIWSNHRIQGQEPPMKKQQIPFRSSVKKK